MNEDIKHDYETEVLDKDYNHNDDTPNTTTAKAGGGAARSQITPENVKNEESDVETSSELVNNEKLRENRLSIARNDISKYEKLYREGINQD